MAFTFFFRDLQALELALDHVAPDLAGRSRPKIWDAGCAMGPEAYTLAILLAYAWPGIFNLKPYLGSLAAFRTPDALGTELHPA